MWVSGDAGSSFTGVQSERYWSSTTYAADKTKAWNVRLLNGNVGGDVKTNETVYYVWPVRGGQS